MRDFKSACALAIGFAVLAAACGGSDCKPLNGTWSNGEGQVLVFKADSTLLWLTRFGSDYDTMQAVYRYDCEQSPKTLDFAEFGSGPFQGKTVYGILEWSSDTSFRIRYNTGTDPAERPAAFDSDLTQQFTAINSTLSY